MRWAVVTNASANYGELHVLNFLTLWLWTWGVSVLLLSCKICLQFQYPVFVNSFKWTFTMIPISPLNQFSIKPILKTLRNIFQVRLFYFKARASQQHNILWEIEIHEREVINPHMIRLRVRVWSEAECPILQWAQWQAGPGPSPALPRTQATPQRCSLH